MSDDLSLLRREFAAFRTEATAQLALLLERTTDRASTCPYQVEIARASNNIARLNKLEQLCRAANRFYNKPAFVGAAAVTATILVEVLRAKGYI